MKSSQAEQRKAVNTPSLWLSTASLEYLGRSRFAITLNRLRPERQIRFGHRESFLSGVTFVEGVNCHVAVAWGDPFVTDADNEFGHLPAPGPEHDSYGQFSGTDGALQRPASPPVSSFATIV